MLTSFSKLFLCILSNTDTITDYCELKTLKTCRQLNCLQIWSDVFNFGSSYHYKSSHLKD